MVILNEIEKSDIVKKLFYISCTLLLTFASCQKEAIEQNPESQVLTLSAAMESPVNASTKTCLDGLTVKWLETDEIIVFDINGRSTKFVIQDISDEGTSADFIEDISFRQSDFDEANLKCACYPYPENGGITFDKDNESITMTLPDEQTWSGSVSFGQGANYSAGVIDDGHVIFKNLCGVIRLDVTGSGLLGDVELKGLDPQTSLYGESTVTLASIATGEPELQPAVAGLNSLTLHCNGAYLSDKTTSLYIIVPAGCFAGTSGNPGLEVTFKDWVTASGRTYSMQSASAQNTVVRSQIKVVPTSGSISFDMPDLTTVWTPASLPDGYTAVDWLQSVANAYIDTRILAGRDDILLSYTAMDGNLCAGFGAEPRQLAGPSVESKNLTRSWYSGTNSATAPAGDYIVHWDPLAGVVTRNGDTILTDTPIEKEDRLDLTLTVFYKHKYNGLTSYSNTMKFRHLRILNETVERRMLMLAVPAKRNSDNVFGIYDFVSGTFLTNAGSGSLTGGND